MPLWWRRVRQNFGISAPRMAVRTHLPWWGRGAMLAVLLAIIGGMWWWGFDFGQIFGGFNRKEVEATLATLDADNAALRAEAIRLRARTSQLESELAMTSGAQATLSKQAAELANENSQIKEELTFLRQLVADSNKQVGLSIQRVVVERERDDAFHYSMLIVRGGNPGDEFDGTVTLNATVQQPPGTAPAHSTVVTLPDDEPASAAALKLKFKYYQRLEGTIRVASGAQVRSVTVRAFEAGEPNPRATRTQTVPQELVR
jgi:hypothetical protein